MPFSPSRMASSGRGLRIHRFVIRIEIIVQITRCSDGTRKVTAVSEITGMERDTITMQDIFVFEKTGMNADGKVCGRFRATGVRPRCAERLAASGFRLPPEMFEHMRAVG